MLKSLVFIYGWTAEKAVHWIAPILGTGLGESLIVYPWQQNSPLTSRTVGLGLLATFVRLFPSLVPPPHPLSSPPLSNPAFNTDAHNHLPRRRLHPARRLRPRRQHRPPLPRRRPPPPRGPENVREARPRVGELTTRLHCREPVSDTVVFLQVRGADTEEPEVPGDVLREEFPFLFGDFFGGFASILNNLHGESTAVHYINQNKSPRCPSSPRYNLPCSTSSPTLANSLSNPLFFLFSLHHLLLAQKLTTDLQRSERALHSLNLASFSIHTQT